MGFLKYGRHNKSILLRILIGFPDPFGNILVDRKLESNVINHDTASLDPCEPFSLTTHNIVKVNQQPIGLWLLGFVAQSTLL